MMTPEAILTAVASTDTRVSRSITTDVLIIGGGATGAGVLLDLTLRGYKAVLAEMNDIGTGTSGRYHGLLHSGGRYAVKDPESAIECIDENRILRVIAPHCIEDTGGLFCSFPQDPPEYAQPFIDGCTRAGIPIEEITVAQARKENPALNPNMVRAIRVPDAALDSFDLVHSICQAATEQGGVVLNYHKVISIEVADSKAIGATLQDRHTGELVRVHSSYIINAAGPWASKIGELIGVHIKMRHSKGVMVAMNTRWTHTIINRLKPPDDGDILVPVGTVCVIGTTSITVPSPDHLEITPAEITQMLDEGEIMIPGFRQARALRAWAGVRPLYEDPSGANMDSEGRDVKRTFSVVDHAKDGISGIASILGGKLTTYRQMAEKITNFVLDQFGTSAPCTTAATVLPAPRRTESRRFHTLPARLDALEHAPTHNNLICECEVVTRSQLESAIRKSGPDVSLDDLRRDLRLGMGPCQAGFCAYRGAGILQETSDQARDEAVSRLRDFVAERFRGARPLLWGHQLRQMLLDESIFRRSLGVTPNSAPDPAPSRLPKLPAAESPAPAPIVNGEG